MSDSEKPEATNENAAENQVNAESKAHGSPAGPQSWVENPAVHQRIFYGLLGACILLFFSDLLYHKHAHFPFEESVGFHALFGFAAYVTIVNSAKLLRRLVSRPEDYYDE